MKQMVKRRYKRICGAMFKIAKGRKRKATDLMVDWIMICERARVVGFDRDEFMEEMMRIKKELKK